ncbi:protein phosphatase 2C domain-containing protein [Jatrophihabitans telluris]|uniref:Protein phosphatase 2C domain-containing protein n=1 Tax=Jatrophihabitans telluris TaxID=2038343 RepID=A0ABY4QUG2_9ACTN|nr:PP2C family serine/threonine-protein phosphatase [Jatrophihabitans telluris]UQX86640.1 protein phosphatase 2C domain-containing protein [Jatrophihabitans telluris]
MLRVNWGSATDVGRVRELNEDSVWAGPTLFVVADGMGGHAAGEVASDIAVSEFRRLSEQRPLSAEDIVAALRQANDRILEAGRQRRERSGLGTTVTGLGLVAAGGSTQWAVFNVGDSRVYRFADNLLSQLTVDHSAVQELVTAGELRREEARFHPRRNVVTRSLGSQPAPAADVWLFPPSPGERFLICSDGLTGELDDAEIARVLFDEPDPQRAAVALVEQANNAGGHDNTTVVVVDVADVDAVAADVDAVDAEAVDVDAGDVEAVDVDGGPRPPADTDGRRQA